MNNLRGSVSSTQSLNGGAAINVAVTPNITIGTVTTLDPNSSVVVELDESSTRMNPIFNFGIPAGKTGEKGDAGSVKFIIVNELPTENIDESAIYMKPSNNPEEQNTYEEYIYVDGTWESLGTAKVEVDLTDYVKNTDYATSTEIGIMQMGTGLYNAGNGKANVNFASKSEIDSRKANTVIGCQLFDYAVGSVKASETQSGTIKAWTSNNEDGEIGLNISTEV